jgi:predicted metalloprotease with PDZ domain
LGPGIRSARRHAVLAAFLLIAPSAAAAQAPVSYHLTFPEARHHRMQVEVTFPDVPPGTLQVVMSRTSPGRYAVHEFAKNVFDVQIDDGRGTALTYEQPAPNQWDVAHGGAVRVRYKVFGDRIDGTFLAVDTTHAHINIPAALMWARGLESRPVRVTFDGAPGWKVATQLVPTEDPRTFTAANLQYLIDSPTELSSFSVRTFRVDQEFRVALHHGGADADVDAFTAGVEKIVREERAVFGELPAFETPYTFIGDFLPSASSDGMEHRNSTILTGAASLDDPHQRVELLATAAHEFFHSWNVERIRPRSLEPFRLDAPNPSGELWFAEGFTSYYEPLVIQRTGIADLQRLAASLGFMVDSVMRTPARRYRSAVDVSRFAQYVDQAVWVDPTYSGNTYLSYYTWGAAIGLALDLSLRARTDHRVTLDHYMRRLWQEYGRPAPPAPGIVARPYTIEDLRRALAEVSGDSVFADEFFARFVHGRDVPDYASLLAPAGLLLRKSRPGRGWIGPVTLDFTGDAARVDAPTIEGTPAFAAGLDRGDEIMSLDGSPIASPGRLEELVQRRKPGDRLRLSIRRRGAVEDRVLVLEEDPRLHVIPVENTGRRLTAAERAFRDAWLGSKQ